MESTGTGLNPAGVGGKLAWNKKGEKNEGFRSVCIWRTGRERRNDHNNSPFSCTVEWNGRMEGVVKDCEWTTLWTTLGVAEVKIWRHLVRKAHTINTESRATDAKGGRGAMGVLWVALAPSGTEFGGSLREGCAKGGKGISWIGNFIRGNPN